MAFGLHKPDQGYWVRVMTASLIGLLTFASAAYAFGQGAVIAEAFPEASYTIPLGGARTIPQGTPVTLEYQTVDGAFAHVGTAITQSQPDERSITIIDWRLEPGRTIAETNRISAEGVGPPVDVRGAANAQKVIEPLYVQGALASVVLLIGAICAYYFVGINKSSVEFLIATDNEMKRVNWSTRKDIIGSTWVVIIFAFLLAGAIFIVDFGFKGFFQAIGVLIKTS